MPERDRHARDRLFDLAKTIRSMNAGGDRITFDVIFADRANYDRVRHSRCAVARIDLPAVSHVS